MGDRLVILIDTHIWIWWVQDKPKLTASQIKHIENLQSNEIGVSVISCLEVARLTAARQITFSVDILDWISAALIYPDVQLLELTPEIAVASTRLPSPFHKDPADRILVATARALDIPILTADAKILSYSHVRTLA
jgi:PIN domain nuclease of toxin-antitoxin system